MFVARFIIFDLQESSKYLIAKGRDEEALAVSLVFLVFDGLPRLVKFVANSVRYPRSFSTSRNATGGRSASRLRISGASRAARCM